jgi:signal transduction histidine kinase
VSPRRRVQNQAAADAAEAEQADTLMTESNFELFEEMPVEGETAVDAAYRAVDQAVARERIRIARELHDGLAADLATSVALFKYYFESASKSETSDPDAVLRTIVEILEGLLASTRNTLRAMRPRRLGTSSVVLELRTAAEEFGRLYGIRVEIWTSGREEDLTVGQREVVYHIVREALTNVRRHSGATMCRVRLAFAAKPFLIEVSDEGKGFGGSNVSGYGLVGMRERAAGIGGRLEVVTTPGRGTTVFLFGPEGAGLS